MIRHKGAVVAVVALAGLASGGGVLPQQTGAGGSGAPQRGWPGGGWFPQQRAGPAGSVYQQARLFDDVLAHVADYYVDSLDERQLYQMAIDGMLDQLRDPYSVFLK